MMSVVDYKNCGNFTAKKEMTSLIFGMTFSYFMGSVVDANEKIAKSGDIVITMGGGDIYKAAYMYRNSKTN